MHKKTTKNYHLTNRQKSPASREPRSSKMTIPSRPSPSMTPGVRANGVSKSRSSGSWEDYPTDNGSWSGEVEDSSSHKVLESWLVVERMLYQEGAQLPHGPLFDECLQWRNQLLHLRISGERGGEARNGEDRSANGSEVSSAAYRREASQGGDEISLEPNIYAKELSSIRSSSQPTRQAREEVLDHIVEYICRELAEIEAEKEAEAAEEAGAELLSGELGEFLRIAPAPKSLGKAPLVSNNLHYSAGDDASPPRRERDEGDAPPGRNRLGTVFNERIIVSPVPFVAATRQSFTTLRKTPIHYIGDDAALDRSGSNARRKLTRRAPHLLPAWDTPVCPTVWPKSVKLTPIDTSRLPSSKRRPTKTADSILPLRRSRNSLSPISRSVQPVSTRLCDHYQKHYEGLAIRGSHIEVPTPRLGKTKASRAKRVPPAN